METKSFRYHLIDSLRGITILSMVLYHATWDLVYIFHNDWQFYQGSLAYVWQQSICWLFIFISGFCWCLSKNPLKHGLIVFSLGLLVSLVTIFFMPSNAICFGILTCLGSCMILMIGFHKLRSSYPKLLWNPFFGFLTSFFLFLFTKKINSGCFGLGDKILYQLPPFLYQGNFATFLGFTDPTFSSTDYFSIIPWYFLFCSGYYFYHMIKDQMKNLSVFSLNIKPFSFLGRHSLFIYVIHQPVIYGFLFIFFQYR